MSVREDIRRLMGEVGMDDPDDFRPGLTATLTPTDEEEIILRVLGGERRGGRSAPPAARPPAAPAQVQVKTIPTPPGSASAKTTTQRQSVKEPEPTPEELDIIRRVLEGERRRPPAQPAPPGAGPPPAGPAPPPYGTATPGYGPAAPQPGIAPRGMAPPPLGQAPPPFPGQQPLVPQPPQPYDRPIAPPATKPYPVTPIPLPSHLETEPFHALGDEIAGLTANELKLDGLLKDPKAKAGRPAVEGQLAQLRLKKVQREEAQEKLAAETRKTFNARFQEFAGLDKELARQSAIIDQGKKTLNNQDPNAVLVHNMAINQWNANKAALDRYGARLRREAEVIGRVEAKERQQAYGWKPGQKPAFKEQPVARVLGPDAYNPFIGGPRRPKTLAEKGLGVAAPFVAETFTKMQQDYAEGVVTGRYPPPLILSQDPKQRANQLREIRELQRDIDKVVAPSLGNIIREDPFRGAETPKPWQIQEWQQRGLAQSSFPSLISTVLKDRKLTPFQKEALGTLATYAQLRVNYEGQFQKSGAVDLGVAAVSQFAGGIATNAGFKILARTAPWMRYIAQPLLAQGERLTLKTLPSFTGRAFKALIKPAPAVALAGGGGGMAASATATGLYGVAKNKKPEEIVTDIGQSLPIGFGMGMAGGLLTHGARTGGRALSQAYGGFRAGSAAQTQARIEALREQARARGMADPDINLFQKELERIARLPKVMEKRLVARLQERVDRWERSKAEIAGTFDIPEHRIVHRFAPAPETGVAPTTPASPAAGGILKGHRTSRGFRLILQDQDGNPILDADGNPVFDVEGRTMPSTVQTARQRFPSETIEGKKGVPKGWKPSTWKPGPTRRPRGPAAPEKLPESGAPRPSAKQEPWETDDPGQMTDDELRAAADEGSDVVTSQVKPRVDHLRQVQKLLEEMERRGLRERHPIADADADTLAGMKDNDLEALIADVERRGYGPIGEHRFGKQLAALNTEYDARAALRLGETFFKDLNKGTLDDADLFELVRLSRANRSPSTERGLRWQQINEVAEETLRERGLTVRTEPLRPTGPAAPARRRPANQFMDAKDDEVQAVIKEREATEAAGKGSDANRAILKDAKAEWKWRLEQKAREAQPTTPATEEPTTPTTPKPAGEEPTPVGEEPVPGAPGTRPPMGGLEGPEPTPPGEGTPPRPGGTPPSEAGGTATGPVPDEGPGPSVLPTQPKRPWDFTATYPGLTPHGQRVKANQAPDEPEEDYARKVHAEFAETVDGLQGEIARVQGHLAPGGEPLTPGREQHLRGQLAAVEARQNRLFEEYRRRFGEDAERAFRRHLQGLPPEEEEGGQGAERPGAPTPTAPAGGETPATGTTPPGRQPAGGVVPGAAVPDAVRNRVRHAVETLQSYQAALKQARDAGRLAGDEDRYVAEIEGQWAERKAAAEQTLASFREKEPKQAEQVISELIGEKAKAPSRKEAIGKIGEVSQVRGGQQLRSKTGGAVYDVGQYDPKTGTWPVTVADPGQTSLKRGEAVTIKPDDFVGMDIVGGEVPQGAGLKYPPEAVQAARDYINGLSGLPQSYARMHLAHLLHGAADVPEGAVHGVTEAETKAIRSNLAAALKGEKPAAEKAPEKKRTRKKPAEKKEGEAEAEDEVAEPTEEAEAAAEPVAEAAPAAPAAPAFKEGEQIVWTRDGKEFSGKVIEAYADGRVFVSVSREGSKNVGGTGKTSIISAADNPRPVTIVPPAAQPAAPATPTPAAAPAAPVAGGNPKIERHTKLPSEVQAALDRGDLLTARTLLGAARESILVDSLKKLISPDDVALLERLALNPAQKLIDDYAARVAAEPAVEEAIPEPEVEAELVPPPPLPVLARGKLTKVSTPDNKFKEVEVRYAIVEIDDLIPSNSVSGARNPNFPRVLQPRDRSELTSIQTTTSRAVDLNPTKLGVNPETSGGAPIIGDEGYVESGNGRTLSVQMAYERRMPSAEAYRTWLAENLADFGLSDPAVVTQARRPILVRIRETKMEPKVREDFVRSSNVAPTERMKEVQQAVEDAKLLTPELMRVFNPDVNGDLEVRQMDEFMAGFIAKMPKNEQGALKAEGGAGPGDLGYRRARNAIFYRAYGDLEALKLLTAPKDDPTKNVTIGMLRAAGPMIALIDGIKGDPERGTEPTVLPQYSLVRDLQRTTSAMVRIRRDRETIEQFLMREQHGTLTEEALSDFQLEILRYLDANKRGAKKFTAVLVAYADRAIKVKPPPAPGAPTLFGGAATTTAAVGGAPPTKAELWQRSVKQIEGEVAEDAAAKQAGPNLFGAPDAGTEGGAGAPPDEAAGDVQAGTPGVAEAAAEAAPAVEPAPAVAPTTWRDPTSVTGGYSGMPETSPDTLPPTPPAHPGHVVPLAHYTPRLFGERSPDKAMLFIDPNTLEPPEGRDQWWSNQAYLALGQGENQGILLEMTTETVPSEQTGLTGSVGTRKPMWAQVWAQGGAEFITRHNSQRRYQEALVAITFLPSTAHIARGAPRRVVAERRIVNVVLPRLRRSMLWTETTNPDGSVTFRRLGWPPIEAGGALGPAPPSAPEAPTAPEPTVAAAAPTVAEPTPAAAPAPPPKDQALLILPCGAEKATTRSKAADLYTGPYFKAALTWALKTGIPHDRIRILSAKHGLVALDQKLDPYEQKMGEPGSISAREVRAQARAQGLSRYTPVVIGGKPYQDLIREVWPERPPALQDPQNPTVSVPLEGLGIGDQISRIQRATDYESLFGPRPRRKDAAHATPLASPEAIAAAKAYAATLTRPERAFALNVLGVELAQRRGPAAPPETVEVARVLEIKNRVIDILLSFPPPSAVAPTTPAPSRRDVATLRREVANKLRHTYHHLLDARRAEASPSGRWDNMTAAGWERNAVNTFAEAEGRLRALGHTDETLERLWQRIRQQVGRQDEGTTPSLSVEPRPGAEPPRGKGKPEKLSPTRAHQFTPAGAPPPGNPDWDAAEEFQPQGDPYFSVLAQVIDAKMSGRMEPVALKKMLLANGVKQGEITWTGLDDFLDTAEGPVTKQDVQNWLATHEVRITELTPTEETPAATLRFRAEGEFPPNQELQDQLKEDILADEIAHYENIFPAVPGESDAGREGRQRWIRDLAKSAVEHRFERDAPVQARGGTIYREPTYGYTILSAADENEHLVLDPDGVQVTWDTSRGELRGPERGSYTRSNAIVLAQRDANSRFKVVSETTKWNRHGLVRPQGRNYRELLLTIRLPARNRSYGHWGAENVLVHIRMNYRMTPDGKRVLFMEEVQSDWFQKLRDNGLMTPEMYEKYDALKAELAVLTRERWDVMEPFTAQIRSLGEEKRALAEQTLNDLVAGQFSLDEFAFDDDEGDDEPPPVARPAPDAHARMMALDAQINELVRQRDEAEKPFYRRERAKEKEIVKLAGAVGGKTEKTSAGPFSQTPEYAALALKRMLRYAAEQGFDYLAWPTGELQVQLFPPTSELADRLEWVPTSEGRGDFRVWQKPKRDDDEDPFAQVPFEADEEGFLHAPPGPPWDPEDPEAFGAALDAHDAQLAAGGGAARRRPPTIPLKDKPPSYVKRNVNEEDLPNYIGRGLAERLVAAGELEEEGLETKDTGMLFFYNQVMASEGRRLVKKFGATVGTVDVDLGLNPTGLRYEGPDVTLDDVNRQMSRLTAMRTHWGRDHRLLSRISDRMVGVDGVSFAEAINTIDDPDRERQNVARMFGGDMIETEAAKGTPVHGIAITPEMVGPYALFAGEITGPPGGWKEEKLIAAWQSMRRGPVDLLDYEGIISDAAADELFANPWVRKAAPVLKRFYARAARQVLTSKQRAKVKRLGFVFLPFPNAVVRGINFRDATDPTGTQGLFVDPWAPLVLNPDYTPEDIAESIVKTLVHEMAHVQERSEGTRFAEVLSDFLEQLADEMDRATAELAETIRRGPGDERWSAGFKAGHVWHDRRVRVPGVRRFQDPPRAEQLGHPLGQSEHGAAGPAAGPDVRPEDRLRLAPGDGPEGDVRPARHPVRGAGPAGPAEAPEGSEPALAALPRTPARVADDRTLTAAYKAVTGKRDGARIIRNQAYRIVATGAIAFRAWDAFMDAAQPAVWPRVPTRVKYHLFFDARTEVSDDYTNQRAPAGPSPAAPTLSGPTPLIRPIPARNTLAANAEQMLSLVSPTSTGPEARLTGTILRRRMGETTRTSVQAYAAFEAAHWLFGKMTAQENYDFIHRVETNEKQPQPPERITIKPKVREVLGPNPLQFIADQMRVWLDFKRDQVRALGIGKLRSFYEHYFPHIWEQKPPGVKDTWAVIMGRNPWEGPMSFLKPRTFPTFKEGLDAGYKPLSDNAVDLVLLKIHEMDRFLEAHHAFDDLLARGLLTFVPEKQPHLAPEGWVKIRDPIGIVYEPPPVVWEAFDKQLMEGLEDFAKTFGITHIRKVRSGVAPWGQWRPGEMVTRVGGPETVLTHEIGHEIDMRYDMQAYFGMPARPGQVRPVGYRRPAGWRQMQTELRALADLRYASRPPMTVPQSFMDYVRSRPEQMANVVHAMIHTPELMATVAPTVAARMQQFIADHPDVAPLFAIRPGLEIASRSDTIKRMSVDIKGHYWAPQRAATIINNYLSPGLGSLPLYRIYRWMGNTFNAVQLGLDAFYLTFAAAEALASKATLIGYHWDDYAAAVARGDQAGATRSAKRAATALISSLLIAPPIVEAFRRGNDVLKEYKQAGIRPEWAEAVAALVSAGAQPGEDPTYRVTAPRTIQKHTRRAWEALLAKEWTEAMKNSAMIVPDLVPAFFHATEWLVMDYLVPRLKVGAFAELAALEIERTLLDGPDATARAIQLAYDTIEDRFGQIRHEKFFIHRSLLDLMRVWRAPGFLQGAISGSYGGLYLDPLERFLATTRAANKFKKAHQQYNLDQAAWVAAGGSGSGTPPPPPPGKFGGFFSDEMPHGPASRNVTSHRTAHLIWGTFIHLWVGGIMTFLYTGDRPKQLLDLLAYNKGRKKPSGHWERGMPPGRLKDHYALLTRPIEALSFKWSPGLTSVDEMVMNRDFHNVMTRDPDKPWSGQAWDTFRYWREFLAPSAINQAAGAWQKGASVVDALSPPLGFGNAPVWIDETKAERKMNQYRRTTEAITQEEWDDQLQRRLLVLQMRGEKVRDLPWPWNKPAPSLLEEYRKRKFSNADVRRMLIKSRTMPLEAGFLSLTAKQASLVYDAATPAERKRLFPLLTRKVLNTAHSAVTSPQEKAALKPIMDRAKSLPREP